ncbi:MAG TPA: metallophosphoesterase [Longimicrobiaceae bacterium]|jgi:predicted MPP superfamily phosphohydrolase|nr:metallophosphoesterase [Longimicrobiaceae bacterium]
MRSTRSLALPLAVCLAAAACGRDGQNPFSRTPVATVPAEPDIQGMYGATGSDNVRVVPVEIEVPHLPAGWDGIRIAAISDFQLGLWADNERVASAAVAKAIAANPDVVVLLGDYVARGEDYTPLDRILAPLKGRPVFAILGTADAADDTNGEPDSVAIRTVAALTRNGVQVLRNTRAPLTRNGSTAYIAGLDPYVARRPDWRQAEIFNGMVGAPSTPVVLSHLAAVGPRIPEGKWPAIIAGHAFCGRVEVPGTPRLSWINTEVFPVANGSPTQRIYRMNGNTLFVTCGIGYSFVPVRYGAPPEVALITLRPALDVKADSAKTPQQPNIDSLVQTYQARRDTARKQEAPPEAPVD